MSKTLVIKTPDTSRQNWKDIRLALARNGFEIHKYHAALQDGGMCIVADVLHAETEQAARAVERELTTGTTLSILH